MHDAMMSRLTVYGHCGFKKTAPEGTDWSAEHSW